ncbi:MAG: hypothetical protein V2A73_08975 [Pseudomonadota bacterium]
MVANRASGMDCTYSELRRSACVVDVEDSLFAEQGGICAYTGHRLRLQKADPNTNTARDVGFHIEHPTPQDYCTAQNGDYGKDADYQNMVACWPRPNCGFEPAYGARRKGNWPSPQEEASFVSPLGSDCSARFMFNHRGEIACAIKGDQAAAKTIEEIGLDHKTLEELRRKAIRGAFNPSGRPLRLNEARRLQTQLDRDFQTLDAGGNVQLAAFCFVIRSALDREIRKLEGIGIERYR